MDDFGIRELTPDTVLAALSEHVGAGNGCTVQQLVREATSLFSDDRLERLARKIVEQLRLKGHHIGAHPSTGYFIARTPEELEATCEFLYQRAMTSLAQVAAMKRVSLPDLRGQLQLPT